MARALSFPVKVATLPLRTLTRRIPQNLIRRQFSILFDSRDRYMSHVGIGRIGAQIFLLVKKRTKIFFRQSYVLSAGFSLFRSA